jgi:hypothetical protein
VHLVGFTIRIYHDARSSECQISVVLVSDLAVVTRMKKSRVQVLVGQTVNIGRKLVILVSTKLLD